MPRVAHHQAQLAGGVFQRVHQTLPVDQPPRFNQTRSQGVAAKIEQLRAGQALPQKLHAGFIELVRLVQNHDIGVRQQLAKAFFFDGHIRKQQVVVDDHDLGSHGRVARARQVAVVVSGALVAQAVFAARGNPRAQARVFGQRRQFSQIARGRAAAPAFNAGQLRQEMGRQALRPRLLHAIDAEVVGAAFEQCRAAVDSKRLHHRGQIAPIKLLLQGFGGC